MNWQALFEPQILFRGEELFEEDKVISFEIKGSEIFSEVESSAGKSTTKFIFVWIRQSRV